MTAPEINFSQSMRQSWGRTSTNHYPVALPRNSDQLDLALHAASVHYGSALPIGLGRSYGDSGLNSTGALIDTTRLNRFLAFDSTTGVLKAQAGVTLEDILLFAIPRGFFLPTTPGTRFVTLGGAIANDVHGKNHLTAGTFGCSVQSIGLKRSDQGTVTTSSTQNEKLFAATVGGMGLTGLIEWAEIQLSPIRSSYLQQETLAFDSLEEFFELVRASDNGFEHRVSWIDCLSPDCRGIYTRANWLEDGELVTRPVDQKLPVPLDTPAFLLNKFSLAAFNECYYRYNRFRAGTSKTLYDSFFYPLDSIRNWNRLYGKPGFFQYQSVIPPETSFEATKSMLELISKSGQGSFLAVLKTFGSKISPGLLSFPVEGTTLALDFPNRGESTIQLLKSLDAIVLEAGGRLYPAKDGRISADVFQAGYPNWEEFAELTDPLMNSDFWNRVSKK